MEVHHHSHSHEKGWRKYVWEFVMLFFAVFSGLMAEYWLEHKIENDREKQFITSLVSDLKTDISNIHLTLESFANQEPYFDTVSANIINVHKSYNPSLMRALKNTLGYRDFVVTDKTLQQLKNAGNLRLIKNNKVTDAIANYDLLLKKFYITSNDAQNQFLKVWEDYQSLFYLEYKDSSELKSKYLLSNNENDFKKYHNHIINDKLLRDIYKRRLFELIECNKNLQILIKQEYHIE